VRKPSDHQIAVAQACDRLSLSEVATEFCISVDRVSRLRNSVRSYHVWAGLSAANEALPVEQRVVQLLPFSEKALRVLRNEGVATVAGLARLSRRDIMRLSGAGKAVATEIDAYLEHRVRTNDSLIARIARRLALQEHVRRNMRPSDDTRAEVWVDRNWPVFVENARDILNDLRDLPETIANAGASACPEAGLDVVMKSWRHMIDAMLAE
jgi:hypothetical protein